MISLLPKHLDGNYALSSYQRMLIHKCSYFEGHVKKTTIKRWLAFLFTTPLYRLYKIIVEDSFFNVKHKQEETAIKIITNVSNKIITASYFELSKKRWCGTKITISDTAHVMKKIITDKQFLKHNLTFFKWISNSIHY